MESLVRHIRGLKRIRFWMTFGQAYLTHLKVLENVGMTRIDAVDYEGHKIIPLRFLKALLPDPGSLGTNYTGKAVIGCVFDGVRDGRRSRKYIYNVCDHAEAFREVQAQAVSYTTGVPAMIGAMMMLTGEWRGAGVVQRRAARSRPLHGLPQPLRSALAGRRFRRPAAGLGR